MIEPQDQTRNELAEYIRLALSTNVGNYGVPEDEIESLAIDLDEGIRIFVAMEIERGIVLRTGIFSDKLDD